MTLRFRLTVWAASSPRFSRLPHYPYLPRCALARSSVEDLLTKGVEQWRYRHHQMRQSRCRTVVLLLPHPLRSPRETFGCLPCKFVRFSLFCATRLIVAIKSPTRSSVGSPRSFSRALQRLASGFWRTSNILVGIDSSSLLRCALDSEICSSPIFLPTCSTASVIPLPD